MLGLALGMIACGRAIKDDEIADLVQRKLLVVVPLDGAFAKKSSVTSHSRSKRRETAFARVFQMLPDCAHPARPTA